MGAPRGNKNAAGPRKPRETRYQNISTVATCVMKDGQNVNLPPRKIVSLSAQDVQDTNDCYSDEDKTPFALGLVAEIPAGKQNHPDAPAATKRQSPEVIRSLLIDGTFAEIEAASESVADTGGLLVWRRACIEVEDKLAKSRVNQIEDIISGLEDKLSSQNAALKRKHAHIGG